MSQLEPDTLTRLHNKLRSLETVRDRSHKILDYVENNRSQSWFLDYSKLPIITKRLVDMIKSKYVSTNFIPPIHGRLAHFQVGGQDRIQTLKTEFFSKTRIDSDIQKEQSLEFGRCLVDLVTVSVLLDAGAGTNWSYTTPDQEKYSRSEGIALATFYSFCSGLFSSSSEKINTRHLTAESNRLRSLTLADIEQIFQVTPNNMIVGLESRLSLMNSLGSALEANPQFFFSDQTYRPGNVLDYIRKQIEQERIESNQKDSNSKTRVSIRILWKAVIEGFESLWPVRKNQPSYQPRGDVWVYKPFLDHSQDQEFGRELIPFHKLSQWLLYSLIEPIEQTLNIEFTDLHLPTALAEYRNGGLFIDAGVIVSKRGDDYLLHGDTNNEEERQKEPGWDMESELVIEWRAVTICLIDKIAVEVRKELQKSEEELPLGRILEAGTWHLGRQFANEKRPSSGSPPIKLNLTGCVF